MDPSEIQQLADLVKKADLQELEIERENMRLRIVNRKNSISIPATHDSFLPDSHTCHPQIVRKDKEEQIANAEKSEDYFIIKSPIVGTFYSAPSPEAPNFVEKNDPVDIHSTVCIIEAMKVMNEIQAEVKGIIAEILVENGQPVEYGQPLFKVKKS